jgi:hypothetical protein
MVRHGRLRYAIPLRLARGGGTAVSGRSALAIGSAGFALGSSVSDFWLSRFFHGISFHGLLVSLVLLSVLLVLLWCLLDASSSRIPPMLPPIPPTPMPNRNCAFAVCEASNNEDHRALKNDTARRSSLTMRREQDRTCFDFKTSSKVLLLPVARCTSQFRDRSRRN